MISAIRRSFNVNLRFIDGRSRVTGNRVKYNVHCTWIRRLEFGFAQFVDIIALIFIH